MYCKNLLSLCFAILLSICCVSNSHAQQKKANPFADNILGTLSNPRMAAELELLDEQKENIDELMKEFGNIRRDIGEQMKDRWEAANDEERKELGKEYWSRIEEGRLDIVKQMKANLLPHQIDRVEQLSAQRMMNEGKGRESAGLLTDQMIGYLDISKDQEQRIKDKSEELKKEVGEKIRKILEDAKQELLSELHPSQKKKYEDLLGDPLADEKKKDEDRTKERRGRNRGR